MKKYLVIMNNVFKFKDFDIGVRFDLKGSSQGRQELTGDKKISDHCATNVNTALKDNDWRKEIKEITVEEVAGRGDLHDIFKKDAEFLATCGIMDYSLLVGHVQILSDNTKVQGVLWSELKDLAMFPEFKSASWFCKLEAEDREKVIRL